MTSYSKIRIIVSDMDETFFASDKSLIPENLQAISDAQAAGIDFAFATGRYWPALKSLVSRLHLRIPQIVDNGALLFDPIANRIVKNIPMDMGCVRFFYDSIRQAGLTPVLSTGLGYYTSSMSPSCKRVMDAHLEIAEIISEEEIFTGARQYVKIVIFGAEVPEKVDALMQWMIPAAEKASLYFSAVYTEKGIVVITARDVNKSKGISNLCRSVGCSMTEVAAIGDGDNDADMLALCGRSFAVANATALAKRHATDNVPSNNEAGFACAIRKILAEPYSKRVVE